MLEPSHFPTLTNIINAQKAMETNIDTPKMSPLPGDAGTSLISAL